MLIFRSLWRKYIFLLFSVVPGLAVGRLGLATASTLEPLDRSLWLGSSFFSWGSFLSANWASAINSFFTALIDGSEVRFTSQLGIRNQKPSCLRQCVCHMFSYHLREEIDYSLADLGLEHRDLAWPVCEYEVGVRLAMGLRKGKQKATSVSPSGRRRTWSNCSRRDLRDGSVKA